jgi:hypothetical protein
MVVGGSGEVMQMGKEGEWYVEGVCGWGRDGTYLQKAVVPNVLPTQNSNIPAANWARPPKANAIPTTMLLYHKYQ